MARHLLWAVPMQRTLSIQILRTTTQRSLRIKDDKWQKEMKEKQSTRWSVLSKNYTEAAKQGGLWAAMTDIPVASGLWQWQLSAVHAGGGTSSSGQGGPEASGERGWCATPSSGSPPSSSWRCLSAAPGASHTRHPMSGRLRSRPPWPVQQLGDGRSLTNSSWLHWLRVVS